MRTTTGLLMIVGVVALVAFFTVFPMPRLMGQNTVGQAAQSSLDSSNAYQANPAIREPPVTQPPAPAKEPPVAQSSTQDTGTQSPIVREPPIVQPTTSQTAASPRSYDVIVVGAGSGGVAAAIQAARLGASVALIEPSNVIGGQMMPVPTMDGGGPGTYNGFFKEFNEQMLQYYSDTTRYPPAGKSIGTCYFAAEARCYEPHVVQIVLHSMLNQAGVTLYTSTNVTKVLKQGNIVTGVTTSAGTMQSKVLIDATEYGDIIPLAGAQYRVGNSISPNINPNSCVDDITYVMIAKRYPNGIPGALQMSTPPPGYAQYRLEFQRIVMKNGSTELSNGYPVNWILHNIYRGLPDSGNPDNYTALNGERITKTAFNFANDYPAYSTYNPLPQGKLAVLKASYIENTTARHKMECEAKLKTINFLYYAQHELGTDWSIADDEGFASSADCANIPQQYKAIERLMPPFPYVRESRRIVSVQTYTGKQMKLNRQGVLPITDSIATGDTGPDKHNCASNDTLEQGESTNDASGAGVYQVPMSALIPQQVDGFLAAEKNIGATRIAEGALRLQPITMATGQAAGALAAITVRQRTQPRNVDPLFVQRELTAAGAGISHYQYPDVPLGSQYWAAVQIASARNLMVGYSDGLFRPSDALTRAQAAIVITKRYNIDVSNPPATPSFTDVPKTSDVYAQAEALKRAGITAGCTATTFCPNDPITRAQLAVFIARASKAAPASQQLYDDVPPTHPLYKYIQAANMPGCAPRKFCPDDTVTRASMATIVS